MAPDALKDNQEGQARKDDNSISILDSRDLSNDHSNSKNENSATEEKAQPGSSNDDSTEKVNTVNEAGTAVAIVEVEPGKLKELTESELQKDPQLGNLKESTEECSKSEGVPSSTEKIEGSLQANHSQITHVSEDADMATIPSENISTCQSVASVSVEEPSQAAKASKDVNMVLDSLPSEKNEEPIKPNSVAGQSEPTKAPNGVDMSSQPSKVKEPQQPVAPDPVVENGATTVDGENNSKKEKPACKELKDDHNIHKMKRAAASAVSAAAIKAKLLANQEEDQIRQLAASLIEKQLHKLDMKLAFFNEMDSVIMRVREQLDRSRQKLYHERAQIIASRLGVPPSSSRAMPATLPTNRIATNFANSVPRPPMGMTSQRPPISRSMGTMPPTTSNPFVSTATAGNPVQPSGQEKLSSVMTK